MKTTNPVLLTKDGLEKLKRDLDQLVSVKRVEIAENLHDTMNGGDSIDNTEYQVVLYDQLMLESRISYLQQIITNSTLIEPGVNGDLVKIGRKVVLEAESEELETYMIVGPIEADPTHGLISYECPLGRAVINRRSGEFVRVKTPDGEVSYRIISVM